jgi:hypothetical protein
MTEKRRTWKAGLSAAAVLVCTATSASAQLLGGGLDGLGNLPGNVLRGVPGTLNNTTQMLDNTINNTQAVVRDTVGRPASSRDFERDVNGARVVRGEVLAVAPSDASLAIAKRLAFETIREESMPSLGLSVVVLRAPDGVSVTDALALLRKADPSGSYDYDHIYDPSGDGGDGAASSDGAASTGVARIGMIDAGVDRRHPALFDAAIERKTFVGNGDGPPTEHGTAVASLLVGQDGDFHGALSGATLYAADVYGGVATGGSADAITRALAWLAGEGVPVVNISLAGPPNLLLAAATAAFLKRGHVLVAAVGNNGPAAGIRFPAGYPGVFGVTSVDAHRAIELDANQGADVAFAARGVNVRAAGLGGKYVTVTGTSFAAPIVAARFAVLLDKPDPAKAARAWLVLEHAAVDLGPPGRNPIFGYGYLDPPAPVGLARSE